jgi:hypothetical protein
MPIHHPKIPHRCTVRVQVISDQLASRSSMGCGFRRLLWRFVEQPLVIISA